MKHDPSNEPLGDDPVWDLLRQVPRREAGPRFTDDVVRAARLAGPGVTWWKRFWIPLTVGSLATAATAIVAVALVLHQPKDDPAPEMVVTPAPNTESFEVLDEMVRTEALLVAADHPSAFTDAELVSLISF